MLYFEFIYRYIDHVYKTSNGILKYNLDTIDILKYEKSNNTTTKTKKKMLQRKISKENDLLIYSQYFSDAGRN